MINERLASEKQIKLLSTLGIKHSHNISVEEASRLIDEKIKFNKSQDGAVSNAAQGTTHAYLHPDTNAKRIRSGVALRYAVDLCVADKIGLHQVEEIADKLFKFMKSLEER